MTNQELAGELRKLAWVYERNPNANQPFATSPVTIYCHSSKETDETIRAFGPGEKKDENTTIDFFPAMFNSNFRVRVSVFKDTSCQRVVIGKRIVPETIVPGLPATPPFTLPEHEEEIVEWHCGPLLKQITDRLNDDLERAVQMAGVTPPDQTQPIDDSDLPF